MAGNKYERVLAAELIVVMGVETADALSGAYPSGPNAGQNGGAKLPDPSRYFATLVVFMALAAVAMFGEKPGKLAAGIGGVASLTILLAPTKASVEAGTPTPLALSVLTYLGQIINGGVQQPGGGTALSESQYQQIEKSVTGPAPTLAPGNRGTNPSNATIGGVGPNVGSLPPSPAPPVYTP